MSNDGHGCLEKSYSASNYHQRLWRGGVGRKSLRRVEQKFFSADENFIQSTDDHAAANAPAFGEMTQYFTSRESGG